MNINTLMNDLYIDEITYVEKKFRSLLNEYTIPLYLNPYHNGSFSIYIKKGCQLGNVWPRSFVRSKKIGCATIVIVSTMDNISNDNHEYAHTTSEYEWLDIIQEFPPIIKRISKSTGLPIINKRVFCQLIYEITGVFLE